MTIATYNVMGGGFIGYNWKADRPERLPQLQRAIRQFDAHFVGLIDTFRWRDTFTPEQIADLFGYPGVYAIPLGDRRLLHDGCDNGIVTLTSVAGVRFDTVRLATRDCVKAVVPHPGGPITIFTVYLDDISWEIRMEQIGALLRQIPGSRTVIMGDMNTVHLHDYPYAGFLGDTVLKLPGIHQLWNRFMGERQHTEPLDLLEQAGFRSATTSSHRTIPTKLLEEFPFPVPPALFRIDYVYHTDDLTVSNVRVPRQDIYDHASDHYPVLCDVS